VREKSVFTGDAPDLFLGKVAEGKKRAAELILGKHAQEIGLVLGRIHAFLQNKPSARLVTENAGVVTCRKTIESTVGFFQLVQKETELDGLVAAHAGIGGPSGEVFALEVGKHVNPVLLSKVHLSEADSEKGADPAGILHVLLFVRAIAGVRGGTPRDVPSVHPHGNPHCLVPGPCDQQCGHGRIHSAAHSDRDPRHTHSPLLLTSWPAWH
jgi:hypothetical protein